VKIIRRLLKIGQLLGFVLLATGCTTVDFEKRQAASGSVRRVDFSQAPELKELAGHARQFGNEMYPKVCALLPDEGAKRPRQFDIILKPLKSQNTGEAHLETRRIYINSSYLTNSPAGQERFDKVLVHEMTHLVQQYRPISLLFWTFQEPASLFWGEGMANYAFYKLLGTNGWSCPECNPRYPHYTSGYTCAGAFLLFVEARYSSNFVPQLNTEMRQRTNTDAFFAKATGMRLDQLWAEFQKTAEFKPGALEAYQLQQTLGYEDGLPPGNVKARFRKYVDRHADAFTRHAVKFASADGKPAKDIQSLIEVYLYFAQPGGSAENAWLELRKMGGVPGIIQGEKGDLAAFVKYDELVSRNFPQTRTLDVHKRGDQTVYHYTMTRVSLESEWKLIKAWRASPDGKVIEELSVP
jgi:hypothetical protein